MKDFTNECPALVVPVGTEVRCDEGHLICKVVEPLAVGALGWASKFGEWQQVAPEIGAPAASLVCEVCGASWVRGLLGLVDAAVPAADDA